MKDMVLSDRDRLALATLADFALLTQKQLDALAFGLRSDTSCKRAIDRLMKTRLITRMDFRIVGSQGGAGSYVYKLSPSGLRFARPNDRYRYKVTNFVHTLAVADAFVALKNLERDGKITIARYATEPDCWAVVGGVELRPDLRVDLSHLLLWIEVDMGTERDRQLLGKLEAVYEAWKRADVSVWPALPKTLWIAPNEARAVVIRKLVSRLPEEAWALFAVCTLETIGEAVDK